ncbi:TetR/AcrR family transcriptional regulator [Dactylosporangium sp. CA-092794]|uniref:TetR/AcrR family transcriptional regulator n=1 Tax=Dactylosporangium sp. CA-092794 TaxID=3239929 RepID=UPI003D8B4A17
MTLPRKPGRPPLLHRDDILAAAVAVIDAEGLEALTMRRLGAALGVAAMSLYRHFPNRDAVLSGVVARLTTSTSYAVRDAWAVSLRSFAVAYRRMLLDHPRAVALLATHPIDAGTGLGLVAPLFEQFAAEGIDQEHAITVVQSVAVFTLGHVLAQVGGEPPDPATAPFYDAWFDAGLTAMLRGFATTGEA